MPEKGSSRHISKSNEELGHCPGCIYWVICIYLYYSNGSHATCKQEEKRQKKLSHVKKRYQKVQMIGKN